MRNSVSNRLLKTVWFPITMVIWKNSWGKGSNLVPSRVFGRLPLMLILSFLCPQSSRLCLFGVGVLPFRLDYGFSLRSELICDIFKPRIGCVVSLLLLLLGIFLRWLLEIAHLNWGFLSTLLRILASILSLGDLLAIWKWPLLILWHFNKFL